jgi:hypothetical protein
MVMILIYSSTLSMLFELSLTTATSERNGVWKPKQPEANDERDTESGDTGSQEQRQELMSIFSRATRNIIGPNSLKNMTSMKMKMAI